MIANFVPLIPVLAGAGGLFAGFKLFKKNDDEETQSNPIVYYTLLFLFVAVLVGVGIYVIKKTTK